MSDTPLLASWNSYPSIFTLGHAAVRDLLTHPVRVEEKIDGSQFSFGRFGEEIRIRSKGQEMRLDAPEALFDRAATTVRALAPSLRDGWTYRAEYLQKPKHNTLAYARIPAQHLILFDIATGLEAYLSPDALAAEAARLGLEAVPVLCAGLVSRTQLDACLQTTSILGSVLIEGVVLKPMTPQYGPDKKPLIAKYVSEAFKETHRKAWREAKPTQTDILTQLIDRYTSPVRWAKAVQHLREAGQLEGAPQDIGALLREVPHDIRQECEAEIKQILFDHFWKDVARGCVRGLPEWYKAQLLAAQIEQEG